MTSGPTAGYISAPAPGPITINTVTGVAASAEVVISQSGTSALNVTNMTILAGSAPEISVPGFTSFTIPAGSVQRYYMNITCSPSAAGVYTATVRLTHNAPDSPANYAVTCNVSQPDTIGQFNSTYSWVSLINTLQSPPPSMNNFNIYAAGTPRLGQWVMGDWNNDGQKTPAVYSGGAFFYTNSLGNNSNWDGVWIGINGPPVAGRFNLSSNNDCLGVVDRATLNGHLVFALYYTCNLTSGATPPISFQWLSEVLPDWQGFTGDYQFVAGDYDGDNLDSIGVRRGPFIAFTNVAPSQGHAAYNLAQYIGTPSNSDYGYAVAGDWDNDGLDSFGLFYQSGDFYRRNDLEWNTGIHIYQRVGIPWGVGPLNVDSWRLMTGGPSGNEIPVVEPNPSPTPETVYVRQLVESDDPSVARTGQWSGQATIAAAGGSYLYSSGGDENTLTLEFVGTSAEIVYVQNPALGSFTIVIDGVAIRSIYTSGESTSFDLGSVVDYLEPGPHTLQIVAIDGIVAIDAFILTVPRDAN